MIGSKLKKKEKDQNGFTLTEVLVTVFVFGTVMIALVGVISSILIAQRKTTAQRRLEQNVRHVSEEMGRKIRTGKIDYDAQQNDPLPNFKGTEKLNLFTVQGLNEAYYLQNQNIYLSSGGTDTALLDDKIDVTNLKFYITPETTPYFGGTATEQSRVTVYLNAETEVNGQVATTRYQTTITSRIYER